MEECVAWYDELGLSQPAGLTTGFATHPDWDWATVAVATCSASCDLKEGGVVEEACMGYNLKRSTALPAGRLDELAALLRA